MDDGAALLRLQEIDLELARVNKALEDLPQREKALQVRNALKSLSRDITKLAGLRKDVEIEISDNRDERVATELLVTDAQSTVEDNANDYRALSDLELRLTNLAKRLEKLDYDHAELEAKLAAYLDKEQQAQQLKARLERRESALVESFKQDANELLQRRKALGEERAALVEDLPEGLLNRYAAALKRFGGQAVERLDGTRPTACRVTLQPSSYSDLRGKTGITTCPYCRRLLVLDRGEE